MERVGNERVANVQQNAPISYGRRPNRLKAASYT